MTDRLITLAIAAAGACSLVLLGLSRRAPEQWWREISPRPTGAALPLPAPAPSIRPIDGPLGPRRGLSPRSLSSDPSHPLPDLAERHSLMAQTNRTSDKIRGSRAASGCGNSSSSSLGGGTPPSTLPLPPLAYYPAPNPIILPGNAYAAWRWCMAPLDRPASSIDPCRSQ